MSFPEESGYSAEHPTGPELLGLLNAERDRVGSTKSYLEVTCIYYESVPEHAVNMMQLGRMAGMVTNPNNEPSYPRSLTDAFYKGEVMAYNFHERSSGEIWSTASYSLFNKNMIKTLSAGRDEEGTHRERMQRIADELMGDLELVDESEMPPALDQLIIDWSEQATDNPEEQWYMILGFRHIIMQVERISSAPHGDASSHPESALSESEKLEDAFYAIVDDDELDDVAVDEVESIDDVRDRIMDAYSDCRLSYGEINEEDEVSVEDASIYLTQALNRELVRIEGVRDEDNKDIIEITGHAAFVIYDANFKPQHVYLLGEGERLCAAIEALIVTDVPNSEGIARLRASQKDPDDNERYVPPKECINPLGVVLVLNDSVIIKPNGEPVYMPKGVTAGVVFNNPDMHMVRYLL